MYTDKEEDYWTQRYDGKETGWDIGYPSTPLKTYIDQQVLVRLAGDFYEGLA